VEAGDACQPRALGSRGRVEAGNTWVAVPRIVAVALAGSDNGGWLLCPVFLMLMGMGRRSTL